MIPEAREVRLRPKIRKVLEARCRAPSTPQGDLKRAQIVLLAAEGRSTRSIAKEVGVQPRIVSKWRHRFADHGLAGVNDRPRASKKPTGRDSFVSKKKTAFDPKIFLAKVGDGKAISQYQKDQI